MKELDELLRDHAEAPIHELDLVARVVELARPERVDEIMRGLPDAMRELVIEWVQETYASGNEVVYFQGGPRWPDHIEAVCEWVRRQGRFHWPRTADEPDMADVRARYGGPPSSVELLKREPFRILRYVKKDNVDKVIANLDADVRDVVIAWAKDALEGEAPVTRWRAREGAVDAMRDWLRRHAST